MNKISKLKLKLNYQLVIHFFLRQGNENSLNLANKKGNKFLIKY